MSLLEILRARLGPVARRAMHVYWRFSRGATIGVRAMVIDPHGRIFLVKHSYVPGWNLPGGGVEVGETFLAALKRELREEANIELTGAPALHAILNSERVSKRDHVALYIVREFRALGPPQRNLEIIDHGFFPPDALPPETWPGTRARIEEVLAGKPSPECW